MHKILGLFGAFWAVRGHIVDLEGPRVPFGTRKSSCMCHYFPSFGRFQQVVGQFWAKKKRLSLALNCRF